MSTIRNTPSELFGLQPLVNRQQGTALASYAGTLPQTGGSGMDPVTGVMIGSAAVNALGSLFNAKADKKTQAAALAEQIRQFDLTRGDQQRRDSVNATQYDPLKQQKSRGNMAMMAAILPQARNVSVGAPKGMERYVPKVSGGLRLPEGGFGQDTLKFFSEGSRAGSEAEFLRALGLPESIITRILTNAGYGAEAVGGTLPRSTTPRATVRGVGGPNGDGGPRGRLSEAF